MRAELICGISGKKTNLGTEAAKQERDESVSNKKMKALNAHVLR